MWITRALHSLLWIRGAGKHARRRRGGGRGTRECSNLFVDGLRPPGAGEDVGAGGVEDEGLGRRLDPGLGVDEAHPL